MVSILRATNKVYLDPTFQSGAWFDAAHQHSLLYHEHSFYAWPHENEYFQPRLVFTVHDISLIRQPIFAILSLDSQILAVQTSKRNITVFDCASKRNWSVRIKNIDGNAILRKGMIWSEHGGNSQDLIIVTNKGLELYKISQARSQCKLSRYLPIPDIEHFWYEPNHRMILLASPQRIGKKGDMQEVFKMNGFFFRAEISDLPKLELPPPEKIQPFDLGPGLLPSDISLITLYGSLYCTCHYTVNGYDYITLYGISKSVVVRSHTLTLSEYSPVIATSVVDNLLCVHLYAVNSIAVFDLKRPVSSRSSSSSQSGSASIVSQYVECICPHAPAVLDESLTSGPKSKRPSLKPNTPAPVQLSVPASAPESDWDAMGDSNHVITEVFSGAVGRSDNEFYESQAQSTMVPFGLARHSSEIGPFSEDLSLSGVPNRFQSPSPPPPMSNDGLSMTGLLDESMIANCASPPDSDLGPVYGVSSEDVLGFEDTPTTPTTPLTTSRSTEGLAMSTAPQTPGFDSNNADQSSVVSYISNDWQFLPPYWMWNRSTKCMWKLTCNLNQFSKSIPDTRRAILFFAQRGQPFRAPRPVFRISENIFLEAKSLMIERVNQAIRGKLTTVWLEVLFKLLIAPYSNELRRLSTKDNATGTQGIGGTDQGDSGKQPQISVVSYPSNVSLSAGTQQLYGNVSSQAAPSSQQTHHSHRSSWTSLFSATNLHGSNSASASQASSHSISAKSDQGPSFDTEPIEPAHAMYMFLPSITAVGSRVKTRGRSVSGATGRFGHDGDAVAKSPLSARRDAFGTLFITQTEMLSYIWLPLILSKPTNLSYDYLRWALCTYITALRSATPPVPVHPSMSILLLNLLVLEGRYVEMSHLVQLQFFPDSIEVAMCALELSDIITESISEQHTSITNIRNTFSANAFSSKFVAADSILSSSTFARTYPGDIIRLKSAIQVLQQVGLDMLWRLQERTTVVRWLLGRGRVMEAITLCMKVRGHWKQGLSPGSISGVDFFVSALEAISLIGHEKGEGWLDSESVDEDDSDSESQNPEVDVGNDKDKRRHSVSSSNMVPGSSIDKSDSVDKDDSIDGWKVGDELQSRRIARVSQLFEPDGFEYIEILRGRRAELLHTVYKFILDWDRASLSPLAAGGRSRLAVHSTFPERLFNKQQNLIFKQLFGYK